MAIDLSDYDIEEQEGVVARLTDALDWRDLQESQDCLIRVQYNEIDMGRTPYHFNQPFEGNEANLYFQRMKEFAGLSVNYIVEHSDYRSHFYRSDIRGNLKKVFDGINKNIAKANPLIFHFALDPDSKATEAMDGGREHLVPLGVWCQHADVHLPYVGRRGATEGD